MLSRSNRPQPLLVTIVFWAMLAIMNEIVSTQLFAQATVLKRLQSGEELGNFLALSWD